MNEELNIDEFENWLKSQADKHRMYPSDKLWRNINQEIHEQEKWPALTFGAVLTGALVTAALIFLHPVKAVFTYPSRSATTVAKVENNYNKEKLAIPVKTLKPIGNKENLYTFNAPATTVNFDEPDNLQQETLVNAVMGDTGEIEELASAASTVNHSASKASVMATVVPNSALSAEDFLNSSTASDNDKSIAANKASALVDSAELLQSENTTVAYNKIRIPDGKKSKWNVEIYGGPSVSYRRLTEPVSYDYHQPYSPAFTSSGPNKVNNFVKQKPAVGFSLGAAYTYSISNRVRIKAGLQFNYRQYSIDAYRSNSERTVLLLNNGLYYPDSVYTYSAISNGQGSVPITLNNRYYQLSVPVGLEVTVVKLSKIHFNIAATIQPTYQLNSNVYQITSDYKSYVQAPNLLRRINLNAGAEANIVFNTKKGLQWTAGPQILYQTLSTQKDNYSIRERLVDYGLRVGVIKQIR